MRSEAKKEKCIDKNHFRENLIDMYIYRAQTFSVKYSTEIIRAFLVHLRT